MSTQPGVRPITERNFEAFLSHAHADKNQIVEAIAKWCQDVAGIKIWYDSNMLHSGLIPQQLGEAIADSQAGILVLSKTSIERNFVQKEAALFEFQPPDFRKIYIKIDDCIVPPYLQADMYIDISANGFDGPAALRLLTALHSHQSRPETIRRTPVYLARGSRPAEVDKARTITSALTTAGFRVVRDFPQAQMDMARLRRIMRGCRAVVALVPYRPTEHKVTSEPILDEVRLALDEGLPLWLIVDDGLDRNLLPLSAIEKRPPLISMSSADIAKSERVAAFAEELRDHLRRPGDLESGASIEGAYSFFGHVYRNVNRPIFEKARRCLEIVTGIPCNSGDELEGDLMQPLIVDRIAQAEFTVFDITDEAGENALNTCIEAGIAMGAKRPIYLLARGERRDPPFMFRNSQVFYYQSELELIGRIRKVALRHRRISE